MIDREAAARVLEANDRGHFTVPTDTLYPHQWMWDSAFISLGWAVLREERAWIEIDSLLSAQWPDGMMPHIVFHPPGSAYFPGPSVWQSATDPPTTGITQPPVLATVVRQLYERGRDRGLAERMARAALPRLLAYHRWLYRARDPEGSGLVAILHPWESGMDNSPAWDTALARVPPERAAVVMGDRGQERAVRSDLALVHPAQRPSNEEYRRYISLVIGFREASYNPDRLYWESPFCVVDVGFNALLHRANLDLAQLLKAVGQEPHEVAVWIDRGREAFDRLWDERAGIYLSLDRRSGRLIEVPTSAGFLPLFAALPDPDRAGRLAATLETWGRAVRFLVPSVEPTHPAFDSLRYWRGPVWVQVNWMLWQGLRRYGFVDLAARLQADTFALVEGHGFREYYDPWTGSGLGGTPSPGARP